MIAVIDYKAGNLTSVMKALTALGAEAQVTEDPAVVRAAERVVLPGVGHFAATARLRETGMEDAVREVIARGVPFLGICVGLQWLFEGSTEARRDAGAWRHARYLRRAFPRRIRCRTWAGIPCSLRRNRGCLPGSAGADLCVLHAQLSRAAGGRDSGVTEYAGPFQRRGGARTMSWACSSIRRSPGDAGLQMLRNFLEVPRC